MFELLKMWVLVEVLGLFCLPLTITVFHNLPDRGWAFSKALGVTIFTFAVWLPQMYFHTLPYSQLFLFGVALLYIGVSIAGFWRTHPLLTNVIRHNITYIIVAELIFLGMVLLLGTLRQFRPDIRSWETFMDEGIIAGIMRSPHLPPNDIWYSGYAINYYYYVHFTMATLGKLIGQTPSIVFNTGISTLFGLTALNLFGVSSNIVAWTKHARTFTKMGKHAVVDPKNISLTESASQSYPNLRGAILFGCCSLIIGVLFGNLASAQQWWMDMSNNLGYYQWFSPSRVIPRTINEFPAFSFLLSDFHAHVLTLAFTILAIGVAFNLLLEYDGTAMHAFGRGWQLPFTLIVSALIIGQLFVMNGWDLPTYLGLALVAIAFQQWLSYGRTFQWIYVVDVALSWTSLIAFTFLLFLPFYASYIVPTGGLGIVKPVDRSGFNFELYIYGFFLFVFVSLLLISTLRRPLLTIVNRAIFKPLLVGLLVVLLLNGMILLLLHNSLTFVIMGDIALAGFVLALYHKQDHAFAFTLLVGTLAFTLVAVSEVVYLRDLFENGYPRMNTIFKFYFQAWALLSVACGSGLFFIFDFFRYASNRQNIWNFRVPRGVIVIWTVCLAALVVASLIYPLMAPAARLSTYDTQTHKMALQPTWSLDGMTYLKTCKPPDIYPDLDSDAVPFCLTDVTHDYDAIRWINANIQGDPILVEAADASSEDYSLYALVSSFTGLPTLMGWPGHEVQWRNGWLQDAANSYSFNRRLSDIDMIYTSNNPQVVLSLMNEYHAQYLYVGSIEYAKYEKFPSHVNLTRFATFMQTVYDKDGVMIYKVK